MRSLRDYASWLHTRWPAGTVEPLPEVREDGSTAVPGLYVVGDLTGVPLLKLAADSGARAVRTIAADPTFERARATDGEGAALDLAIVGAGVSGMAAALEARALGLRFELLESTAPFSTVANFPRKKPIYTYPLDLTPAGALQVSAEVKEDLLAELSAQTRGIEPRSARALHVQRRGGLLEVVLADGPPLVARRVIVAVGRSGSFRKLGVPGEELGKVSNRLHDPRDFAGQRVLVVGGGDSALEAAIALVRAGADVTLAHRGTELARPKPDNVAKLEALLGDPTAEVAVERPSSERVTTATGPFMARGPAQGRLTLRLGATVHAIEDGRVTLSAADGGELALENEAVFVMIGREAPLDFFRRSGVPIQGELHPRSWVLLGLFLLACAFVYHWKSFLALNAAFKRNGWFPYGLPALSDDPTSLLGVLSVSLREPGFWYSAAYCALVLGFGLQRIRRRRTPYVTAQTWTLIAIQWLPLFVLPYLLLPWLGRSGWFDGGWLGAAADALFPAVSSGHGREYWRAFGLVLAWPLFIWNVFTAQPLGAWLAISVVQTFVLIPLLVWRWGKGAYCGWICSCGALAETLGDAHRHKMPHGPGWNRLNLLGQVILAVALLMLGARLISWTWPDSLLGQWHGWLYRQALEGRVGGIAINYYTVVDLTLAGILGVGLYFWFSGRTWCRFACPLAALMHVYARFSRFRILARKERCISCNVCTSVCHQGIDVMGFANKGLPVEDPQCVRCSACVSACPTGVLEFGRVARDGRVLGTDRLPARRLPVVK